MRTFVILNCYKGVDSWENVVEKLPKGEKKLVYLGEGAEKEEFDGKHAEKYEEFCVETRSFPEELRHHGSKLRNFVSKDIIEAKLGGFVHIIENSARILRDPGAFLGEIERMMKVLGLKTWFNTSCDMCNYVYNKYNPRVFVAIDEPEAKKVYDKVVAWCSNANTVWICCDMDRAQFEDVRFEERFSFPMYYIIEFLARRRNTKAAGDLDYMNYYPSVEEELGVFDTVQTNDGFKFKDEDLKAENELFRNGMKVDNHPDSDLDALMGDIRNKLVGG